MPRVHPFASFGFARPPSLTGGVPLDVSSVIAPPYDVLDHESKARLLSRSSHNVVAIDLPHIPAKHLGPPEAYENAQRMLDDWLARGTLAVHHQPCMFVYRQTFTSGGKSRTRTGMACTIDVVPFGPREGGGVLPHEETFSGPKQDRLALMKSTAAQLSPIFALHQDSAARSISLLDSFVAARTPDFVASTDDSVSHQVWRITAPEELSAYQAALAGEDILIADGHHRYSTSINYLTELQTQGQLPPTHPARQCMVVLVSMQDPGLEIWPTHRVLGGMKLYSLEAFKSACADRLNFEPVPAGLDALPDSLQRGPQSSIRLGVWDIATDSAWVITPKNPDPLAELHSYKPDVWRRLDTAVIQHMLVEEVFQPLLNEDCGVQWAFPHTLDEVRAIAQGKGSGSTTGKSFTPQVALIVRPTPIASVAEMARLGELMPQKSTFFFPKLATGLFMRRLIG